MQLRHQHHYTKSQGKPFSSVSSQWQQGTSDPQAVQGTGLCQMLEDSDTVSHIYALKRYSWRNVSCCCRHQSWQWKHCLYWLETAFLSAKKDSPLQNWKVFLHWSCVRSWKELFNISWLPCFNSTMPYNFSPSHGNPFCFSDRYCVQSGIFPGYTSSSSLENSRFSSFWCVVTRGYGRLDRKHLSFLGVKGHLGLTIFFNL